MFDLQKRGYGVRKGIPSIVVAASSFDDVVAIAGAPVAAMCRVPLCPCTPLCLCMRLGCVLSSVDRKRAVVQMQQSAVHIRDAAQQQISVTAKQQDIWVAEQQPCRQHCSVGAGYSLCIGLAVPSGESNAMDIAEGPINVVAGFVFGGIAGGLLGCTRLWRNRALRTLATLLLCQLLMFAALHFHYTGAGAMASLMMAIVGSKLWANRRLPHWYHTDASPEHAHVAENDIALFWRHVAQPLLFGIIGTAVDFSKLSPSSIPKALIVIALGVCIRLPTASLVTFGAGLNLKERCAAMSDLASGTDQHGHGLFLLAACVLG